MEHSRPSRSCRCPAKEPAARNPAPAAVLANPAVSGTGWEGTEDIDRCLEHRLVIEGEYGFPGVYQPIGDVAPVQSSPEVSAVANHPDRWCRFLASLVRTTEFQTIKICVEQGGGSDQQSQPQTRMLLGCRLSSVMSSLDG